VCGLVVVVVECELVVVDIVLVVVGCGMRRAVLVDAVFVVVCGVCVARLCAV
jgi:hypothetical protein